MLPPRKFLLLTMGVVSPWSSDEERIKDIERYLERIKYVKSFFKNPEDQELALKLCNPKTVKDLKRAIQFGVRVLGNEANLNWIDTSNITDMSYLFMGSKFNGDISKWDVSKVEHKKDMFKDSAFTGAKPQWDSAKLKD